VQAATKLPDNWELPRVAAPEDHLIFYREPKNQEAFSFLNDGKSQEGAVSIGDKKLLQSKIIVSTSELPAVAISFNQQWEVLRWGLQSIKGENPWPHPLA